MVEANLQSDNCKDLAIGQTPKIGGVFLMKMFFFKSCRIYHNDFLILR